MVISRSERQWQVLLTEYKSCMQKLRSKKEAQKIILEELAISRLQKDELANTLESLKLAAKEIIHGGSSVNLQKLNLDEKCNSVKGLVLHVMTLNTEADAQKNRTMDLETYIADLEKDIKALRSDKTGYNRVTSPVPCAEREMYLEKISILQQQVECLQQQRKTVSDELTDIKLETDGYKKELSLAREQLSERTSCKPIADIENLLEENRILRDKVEKLQQINAALVTHKALPGKIEDSSDKLPSALRYPSYQINYPGSGVAKKRRSNKPFKSVKFVSSDTDNVTASHSLSEVFKARIRDRIEAETELKRLQKLLHDIQKVSNGLAETVLDKNIALNHQRESNRLLGERVCELEAKLRALEMSGFWNIPEYHDSEVEETKRNVLRKLTLASASSQYESDAGTTIDGLVGSLVSPESDSEINVFAKGESFPFAESDKISFPIVSSQTPDILSFDSDTEDVDETQALLLNDDKLKMFLFDDECDVKKELDTIPVKENI